MNFLLLCIQSSVCIMVVLLVKKMGIISFRSFDWQDAKTWFPISFMLVGIAHPLIGVRSVKSYCAGLGNIHWLKKSGE